MATYTAKSVTVSRKPSENKDGTWSAFLGLFKENNPHLHGKAPFKVLEYKRIEKVRIKDLRNISYYLAGNDLVINDLTEIHLMQEKNILTLMGRQKLPEMPE